jgi:glutaconate CoA-transferase subunit B
MRDFSLAELCIVAGADIFRDETPEVFATLIGLVPRLAGSLAKKTFLPGLMMTDGEYYFVSEPVPVGPRNGYQPKKEGQSGYERVVDLIAKGNRHAFVDELVDHWRL